jgi:hypothetical protein
MPFCICRRRRRKVHTRKVHKKERKIMMMKMNVVELNNSNTKQQQQQQNKSSLASKERIEEESKRIQEKSVRNRQAKIKLLLLEGVVGSTGGGEDGDSNRSQKNTSVSSRKKSLNESYDRWNKQGTSFIVDNNSSSSKNLKMNSTTTAITTAKNKNKKEKKEKLLVMTTIEESFEVGDRVMKKVKNEITKQIITHGPYIIINYLGSIDVNTEDKVIIRTTSSFTPVYETISVTKVVPYKEYYE